MDSTIDRIIGTDEKTPDSEEPLETTSPDQPENAARLGSEDAEIDELANLWTTGNKGEVIRRYVEMNNEDCVKLVFAIGIDGAIELARMVDQMAVEEENPEDEHPGEYSTEPSRIEPASGEPATDTVKDIIGQPENATEP